MSIPKLYLLVDELRMLAKSRAGLGLNHAFPPVEGLIGTAEYRAYCDRAVVTACTILV